MVKLTEAQRCILSHLSRRKVWDGAPDGAEISASLGHSPRWAYGKLVSLAKRGLAAPLGFSFNSGKTWTITEAGRAALTKEGKQ